MNIQNIIRKTMSAAKQMAADALSLLRNDKSGKGLEASKKNVLLVLYIIIIVLINVVSLSLNSRCDLTRKHTYSLSQKSKEIVSNLKENLKIKVLFSKDLPAQHSAILRYLKDLLEEYNYYGNEFFSYEIIPDSDLEKQAGDYGIRPVQSQEFESDQVKVRRTYMALVIQQSDLVEKIDALTDPTGIEYQITSLIEKMSGKIDGLLRLKRPIQAILFLDSKLKGLSIEGMDSLEKKVREAVDKSNAINYDKLRLKVVDPSEDKTAGVSAELYGVGKLNWKGGADRTGRFIPAGEAFLGLVLKSQDKVELIELSVAPTMFGKNVVVGIDKIDDRINKAVTSLVSANPRIGYLTGHDEVNLNDQQSPEGGALLRQVLSDVYEVKEIDLSKEDIPEDLGVIIVNGPKREFAETELFKIDQFIMKGKAAIFFLDSFTEVNMGQQSPFGRQPLMLPIVTGLEPLLKTYGVSISKNIVLDSSCARGQIGGTPKDFYFVPIIKKTGLSPDSVITKFLKGVAFIKSSSVEVDKKKMQERKLSYLGLVSSSDESWQMTGEINLNPFFIVPPKNRADMKKFTLAALVSGKFESYFKTKDVPRDEAKDKEKKGIVSVSRRIESTVQSGTSRIIVVGTSEITKSLFLQNARQIVSSVTSEREQEKIFANGVMLHSMVDYLAGNSYIPEMSSKSLDYNPLEKTGEGKKIAIKTVNIAGVPLLIIVAGLVIWNRRNTRKKRLLEEFSRRVKRDE